MDFSTLCSSILFMMGILTIISGWRAYQRSLHLTAGWETTTGTITKSQIKHSDERGMEVYADIEYEYLAHGMERRGTVVSFPPMVWTASSANRIVEKYPIGSKAQVYFDPNSTFKAVLIRKKDINLLILGIALILSATTVWLFT
jgi:hypothetical protein